MYLSAAMIGASVIALMATVVPYLLTYGSGYMAPFAGRDSDIIRTKYLPAYALPTFSGYLWADKDTGARMFYTYYEAKNPAGAANETPILLWLQGGPGCSSMIGNFYELGPYRVHDDLRLNENPAPWNDKFGVLFVDNPVGTGFSIAEADAHVPTNQGGVAAHLLSATGQFFSEHPGFLTRPFFLAGESYAGKYVPAFGHHIMEVKEADPAAAPFRLDGLVIGDGLTDPAIQVQTHGATAHAFGIIDEAQRERADAWAKDIVGLVAREDWQAAYVARTGLVNWIQNVSGIATPLDVRRDHAYHHTRGGREYLALFLNQAKVKAALGADAAVKWVSCSSRVRRIMSNDTMKSTRWMVEALLPRLPLLLYQGMYDVKDGAMCSEAWMRALRWPHADGFFAAERTLWKVNGKLAGYHRRHKTLTHVVLHGAGHEVPADQAANSQSMIEDWVQSVLLRSSGG